MSDKPTCKTCRWWSPMGLVDGDCRALPPTVITITESVMVSGHVGMIRKSPHMIATGRRTVWPSTDAGDWCGQHTPEDPIDPADVASLPGYDELPIRARRLSELIAMSGEFNLEYIRDNSRNGIKRVRGIGKKTLGEIRAWADRLESQGLIK